MTFKLTMPDPELLKKIDFKNPATWIATWFGCGLMRPAPGTWGTIGGLPIALIILALLGKSGLVVALIVLMPVALWSAKKFSAMTQTHDNSMIVIDEVVGIWITLLASSLSPLSILAAVLLFRAFDILKPWPISVVDKRVKGAFGVMADDVLAGVFAGLVLFGVETYAFSG